MGAITRTIEEVITKRSESSGTYNPAQWLIDWVTGGEESSSGVKINQNSALKYTPFWAAVRIISGTMASLPFIVYQRINNGGKERVPSHPIYKLLHDKPNEYMDAVTFIETRQAHVLSYGNGYAEIQRNNGGKPIALWPLLPDRTFRKIDDNGIPFYEIHLPKGGKVNLADYNVLHIKGLGFDGYTGYDVVTYHKEALGYGVAVKRFGAKFFANDASPGGIYEHPGQLGEKAHKHLKESLILEHQGLSKAHRIQILEEGMKWTQTGVDPQQAQALEVQKYNVDDCARIFNLPPHKIGSMEYSKYNNIEEENIDFVIRMLYWFRKWEQECNYKLFMPSEQATLFCEILVDALLRGKLLTRYQAYNIGRNAGFLCVNDIREKENMNKIGPKGDIFLEPLNMKPAGNPMPAKKNGDSDDDNIREAHRNLLITQWLRIIHKQEGLLKSSQYNYQENRKYARKILTESSIAYASTCNRIEAEVHEILDSVINEHINSQIQLNDNDAEQLADLLIEQIGDNHAAT